VSNGINIIVFRASCNLEYWNRRRWLFKRVSRTALVTMLRVLSAFYQILQAGAVVQSAGDTLSFWSFRRLEL